MYSVTMTHRNLGRALFTAAARQVEYESRPRFHTYGEANRWAIEHCWIEPMHITLVTNDERPGYCLVAYTSLGEIAGLWGRGAFIDASCGADITEIPALAAETVAWYQARVVSDGCHV